MNFPFFKKKIDPAVLPESDQYYGPAKEERAGVAWALALGTLLITLAVALGLFFGGRWLYRKVVQNEDKQVSQPQTPVTVETPGTDEVPPPPQLQGSQPADDDSDNDDTPSRSTTKKSKIPHTGPSGPESEQ